MQVVDMTGEFVVFFDRALPEPRLPEPTSPLAPVANGGLNFIAAA